MSKNGIQELKEFLEEKINQLKKELEFYELMLSIIESGRNNPWIRGPRAGESVLEIKDNTGAIIAYIFVGKEYLRIVPLHEIETKNPYFEFLIRYLEDQKRKDTEAAKRGVIPENKILDYEIRAENGIVREIVVRNYKGSKIFLVELQAAVVYSLEKARQQITA